MNDVAKVLFVDDEVNVLNSIRRYVFDEDGWECLFAGSGLEALAVLASHPDVAVVVSDMRMPGMDGLTLLREVKDTYPLMVRVVLSGYTQLQQLLMVINRGEVFRFVAKPWSKDQELKAAIEDAIEQHRLLMRNAMIMDIIGEQAGEISVPQMFVELQLRNKAVDSLVCDHFSVLGSSMSAEEINAFRAFVFRIRDWMVLTKHTQLGDQLAELTGVLEASKRLVLSENVCELTGEEQEFLVFDHLLVECYHALNEYLLMGNRCQMFVYAGAEKPEDVESPLVFRLRARHGSAPPSAPEVIPAKLGFFNSAAKVALIRDNLTVQVEYTDEFILTLTIGRPSWG